MNARAKHKNLKDRAVKVYLITLNLKFKRVQSSYCVRNKGFLAIGIAVFFVCTITTLIEFQPTQENDEIIDLQTFNEINKINVNNQINENYDLQFRVPEKVEIDRSENKFENIFYSFLKLFFTFKSSNSTRASESGRIDNK